jgi:pimeloyl-ACP methyl ester carboxylesterase
MMAVGVRWLAILRRSPRGANNEDGDVEGMILARLRGVTAAHLTRSVGVVGLACGIVACEPSAVSSGPAEPPKLDPKVSPPRSDDPLPADPGPRPPLPKTTFTFSPCTGAYAAARTCGVAKVPLDYGSPEGAKIEIFVARMGSAEPSAPQLYALEGGPGGSANELIPVLATLVEGRPDLDVIYVEHRGVGRSTPLSCPTAGAVVDVAAQATACVAEVTAARGNVLAHFTTSNAARDLAVTIQSLRTNEQAFVYGVSYGTYWAHRFLQLSPFDIDGVILDSAASNTQFFDTFQTQNDPALRRIAEHCKSDLACRAALGEDPFARMASIIGGTGSLTCGAALGIDRALLTEIVIGMLRYRSTAELVPSFLARFERCSSADQDAITRLQDALFAPRPEGKAALDPAEVLPGEVLYYNIVFSELWSKPAPSLLSLEQRLATQVVSSRSILDLARREVVWPHYPSDLYTRQWATTTMPVLTLNGDLDVQTPIETARAFESSLGGEHTHFVHIPWANHGVIDQSPMEGGGHCGLELIHAFLANPKAAPDTSCTARTLPPNLSSDPDTLGALYGTSDAWAGVGGRSVAPEIAKRITTAVQRHVAGSLYVNVRPPSPRLANPLPLPVPLPRILMETPSTPGPQ